jgi:signal transduction histidine kinase/DNA-binding response OmpR family regulator
MTTPSAVMPSKVTRRTLSPLQVGLLVVVALLAMLIEALIFRAYFNSVSTATFFREASFITTDLAKLQREIILLHVEIDRYLQDPETGFNALAVCRSLLLNQIDLQTAQAAGNPRVAAELTEIRQTFDEFDALFSRITEDPHLVDTDVAPQVRSALTHMEHQVKLLYDSEEMNFFVATSQALAVQRNTGLLLLTLGALVMMLGVVLALSLNRTFRALRTEMAERIRAEETNRQLTEGLERRVIERTTELTETLEQLEEVSRHKSEFLANMSHELRTPLNAIIGYSEMLREQAVENHFQELVPDLDRIKVSGRHLLELVNEVLDFSKIEAGRMDLYLESFHVPSMVGDVASFIQPLAEKNYNTLHVVCDESAGYMHADLTKVRQTLFNLLSNACKFTQNGTIVLATSRCREDGVEWISFRVSDTGIGISQEQMGRLFQPFSQADTSTTRKYGGSGLGLVVSRNFCRLMGGDISVESAEGRGSTFTCTLPAQVGPDCSTVPLPPADTPSARNGHSKLILVIDDDEGLSNLIGRQLTQEGFRVKCAGQGTQGLNLARRLRPSAILLDVFMPEMDGWAVLVELKSDPELAEIPVIMLSGSTNLNLAYSLGAADYLIKPIESNRLVKVINKHRPTSGPYMAVVVDDDPENRRLMGRVLESEGWLVTEAADGSQGLKRLMERRPDLVLLDLMMPSMDGFEFVEEISDHPEWRNIPVVVMTARDLSPDDRNRLNGRIRKIITKGAYTRGQVAQELRRQMNAMPAVSSPGHL